MTRRNAAHVPADAEKLQAAIKFFLDRAKADAEQYHREHPIKAWWFEYWMSKVGGKDAMTKKKLADLIERQCDDMACGTQDRAFLRNDDGSEPVMRELLRKNLEQFARRLGSLLGT